MGPPADVGAGRPAGFAVSALMIAKPGIAIGVAAAGFAGMTLAGRSLPDPGAGALLIICILMAAAGSAMINVVLEAETDAAMPRTAGRAAALARVGGGTAMALSLSLIAVSLTLSLIFINALTGLLILAAALSYTVLYTLYLKRRSPFGTVMGGIPGALPALIGYAAVRPDIGMDGVILFFIMLLWQPLHFLALSLKHRDEYAAAGLPVMPVACGEAYTKGFMFIYASALPVLTLSLWAFGYCSAWFAVFATGLGGFFLVSCYINVVRNRRYGRAFAASIAYIMLLLMGVVVDVATNGPISH